MTNTDLSHLLEQLHPNLQPDPISLWPLAPGWWLLLMLCMLFLYFFICYYVRWRKRSYRRQAVKQCLALFASENKTQPEIIKALNHLLKRVALTSFPRPVAASLNSGQWLKFLDHTGNTKAFSHGVGKILGAQSYQAEGVWNTIELKQLKILTIRWIRNHNV